MSNIPEAAIEGVVSALVGTSDSVIAVMFRLDIDYEVDEMEAALADDLQRCNSCGLWVEYDSLHSFKCPDCKSMNAQNDD